MLLLLMGAAAAVPDARPTAPQPADETITVTGKRLPQGAAEVESRPGGADLVRSDDYKDKVAVSLRDALAFSPGVYAQPRFGQEVRLSIRGSGISRGFHMRGLTLLQDGVPINLADDNGDFQELDPTILEQLEVYRGANAFRFGGTTLGGAVNGVTPTGRSAPGLRLRMDGGSFGTVRGVGSYGWNRAGTEAWLAIAADRSNGDRRHSKRHSLRVNGNVAIALSETARSRFHLSANHIRQELPGALPYPLAVNSPGNGSDAGDQQRNIDSLRIHNRTTIELNPLALEFGVFANAKALDHPIFQLVDQDSLDMGLFGRAAWRTGRLELLAGATARFGTVDSRRFVNIDGEPGARTFAADQEARTIDLYGEGRWTADRLTLIAGAIYTHGRRAQVQRFPAMVRAAASFSQLSPRFGLIWEPVRGIAAYANVSRSHELPGFIELAQISSFVPLKPQKAWTTEIGVRGAVGPAKFELSLYRSAVRDELLQFNVGPGIPASTFNAKRTLHQGIEAGLDVDLSSWASLRQVFQLNDFRFRGDRQFADNRLPVIPRQLYRAELRLGPDRWHVSPSLEWVPGGAWSDYANSFRADGYMMLAASGALTIAPRTEVFIDARNLADRKAVGDIGAVVDYRALRPAQQAIFYPIERRSLYAGLRTRW